MAGNYKNKEQKQQDAKLRQEKTASLTPQQRIQSLDKKLGSGIGAVKERKRLNSLISEESQNKKK